MSRPSRGRKVRPHELRKLHRLLDAPPHPPNPTGLLEAPWPGGPPPRAEPLLPPAAGVSASAIARLVEVHPHTTYADLRAFRRQGLGSVCQPRRLGAPPRLTPAQRA